LLVISLYIFQCFNRDLFIDDDNSKLYLCNVVNINSFFYLLKKFLISFNSLNFNSVILSNLVGYEERRIFFSNILKQKNYEEVDLFFSLLVSVNKKMFYSLVDVDV